MGTFILGFLFVVVIPLAEGVLLALLLREVHNRYPLPLGGIIPTDKPDDSTETESAETKTQENEFLAADTEGVNLEQHHDIVTPQTAEPVQEPETVSPAGPSVFDEATDISDSLLIQVNGVINSMTTEESVTIPNELEKRIEEAAQSVPNTDVSVDMDEEDLEALVAALPGSQPGEKIDFVNELEPQESSSSDDISPEARDILGEDFDVNSLESQALKIEVPAENEETADVDRVSIDDVVENGVIENVEKQYSTESGQELPEPNASQNKNVSLDIQESEDGVVQVLSPFLTGISQLADFAVPEMVLPAFSGDWIQETDSTFESADAASENAAKFCFTEESRPMFVRKKKAN